MTIAHEVTQSAGHPVAGDSVSDGAAHDEADRRARHVRMNVNGQWSVPAAPTPPHHGLELGAAA